MLNKIILIVWPLVVTALALSYHKKQNGEKPLTGGPISMPKSFWLAYTVSTWFFLPLSFFLFPNISGDLQAALIFHLASWWIRGPLELFMIYKFFNWTPKYGISHDAFHIAGLIYFLSRHFPEIQSLDFYNFILLCFLLITILATVAEITFAFLFLRARSKEEELDNVYFASDDPKWIFINRATLFFVTIMMGHLIWQSLYTISSFFKT